MYGKCTGKVVPPKFKIGNKVRVNKYKSTFEKGYKMTFHNEIYTIYKVDVGSSTVYKLIDEEDGDTILEDFTSGNYSFLKDPNKLKDVRPK